GQRILAAGFDQVARICDANTGDLQVELRGHTSVIDSVAFSPDGERILTCSSDGTARIWDTRTGHPLLELAGYVGALENVRSTTPGNLQPGLARLRRTLSGKTSAVFSPDGKQILMGGAD